MNASMITRRTFLRSSAALAVLAAGPRLLTARPGRDPMDRIALTTVTFRFRFAATRPHDYAGTEGLLRLTDVPPFFADRFGVHNVELWSLHFESTAPSYLRDLRKAISDADSRLINIQIDHPYNLAASDEQTRRESIALVKEWVDVARTLGAPSVRANTGTGTVEASIQSLRELNEYAAERGILLLTENHGGISTDTDVLVQILKGIPSDNFRAVADFGNFPEETDRYEALARLIPHTHLISAKTRVFDAEGHHISFDYDRCIRTAENAGFRGIYSAEQWDPSTDPLDAEYIADWMIEHIRANLIT
ncbi:MAG: sugar phosphate isomerase/epimerase family protein [Verrucomicrobiales bacterium]